MKRLVRNRITASGTTAKSDRRFSAMEITQLLSEIEELKEYNIIFSEAPNGNIQFTIGNCMYEMSGDDLQPIV